MPAKLDHFDDSDVQLSIAQIEDLLATGILLEPTSRLSIKRAVFLSILVHARDLMAKAEKFASRIDFSDDVVSALEPTGVNDVTDLIKFVRNAMCHLDSQNHFLTPGIKMTFGVMHGKVPRFISIGGKPYGPTSEYPDDTAFVFGPHRIYYKRHILRAFEEAKQKLIPLTSIPTFPKS